ncbi:MAG TPA: helix-turn-helix domain-containing protein, partial [Pseudonocardia sp.]
MTVRSDPPSGPDPEAGPESLLGPAGPSAPADAGQAGAPTGGQVGPPITVHAGELTADRAGERATAQAAGESAEARILRAALTLFARQGFSATGVRALGREAGVSPGLVLHYFGSKEGLRAAVERLVTSRVA